MKAKTLKKNKVKYEIVPQLEVKEYTNQKIEIPEFEVKDSDVEKEIEAGFEIAFDGRVADHHEQHEEQRGHQRFDCSFDAVLKATTDNKKCDRQEHGMPQRHRHRTGQQAVELAGDLGGRCATKAVRGLADVAQRPSGDNTVIGRDQEADDHTHPADDRPALRTPGALG